jgi:hypothetical protein
MAKNASPGAMLRVSMEMPLTEAGSAPTRSAAMALAIASKVQSGTDVMMPSSVLDRSRGRIADSASRAETSGAPHS